MKFGRGGIRTHETLSRLHAFQACSIGHSDTHPIGGRYFRDKDDNWQESLFLNYF